MWCELTNYMDLKVIHNIIPFIIFNLFIYFLLLYLFLRQYISNYNDTEHTTTYDRLRSLVRNPASSFTLDDFTLASSSTERNLGVIFYRDMSFNSHVRLSSWAAFFYFCNIAKIRPIVSHVYAGCWTSGLDWTIVIPYHQAAPISPQRVYRWSRMQRHVLELEWEIIFTQLLWIGYLWNPG